MRRIATGDTTAAVPNLTRANEVGDMARAVQVFKEQSIENHRLQQEEARRRLELATASAEAQAATRAKRSEESREGYRGVNAGRTRWAPYPHKKKTESKEIV